jgi:hypothetical protein
MGLGKLPARQDNFPVTRETTRGQEGMGIRARGIREVLGAR